MSIFKDSFKRANAFAIEAMGDEGVVINGHRCRASVQGATASPLFKIGGKTSGVEATVIANKDDFDNSGATKNSKVLWDGKQALILSIADEQDGVVTLSCGPFKSGNI